MNRYTFKAKIKDNGEWIYGSYVHQMDYYGTKVDKHFIIQGTSTQDYDIDENIEIDFTTLCQCTGLQDIDGNYIFENDILDIFETDKEHKHLISNNCNVDYDVKYFTHFIHCNNDEYYSVTNLKELNSFKEVIKFKIIGNKFDKEVE